MEIKTGIFEGTYEFEIKLDEYKPEGESVFELTLDKQTIIITREEWRALNDLVHNSMDFLDENDDNK